MKILTLVSGKGGVGRTTLTLNLAYAMAQRGFRVLAAEVDPAAGFRQALPAMKESNGVARWMTGTPLSQCYTETRIDTLKILEVGPIPLRDRGEFHEELASGSQVRRLAKEAGEEGFDLLMLDTPAGLAGATLGAIRGGEYVLVPVQAEPLAARALIPLLEGLAELRNEGATGVLTGFVVNMFQQRDPDSLSVVLDLWSSFPPLLVLESVIPRDPIFGRASTLGVPVALLRRQAPPMARVFEQLAEEVEYRLGLRPYPENEEDEDKPICLFS